MGVSPINTVFHAQASGANSRGDAVTLLEKGVDLTKRVLVNNTHHLNNAMRQFIEKHAASVTGSLTGLQRMWCRH